jgi:hypothetical protein
MRKLSLAAVLVAALVCAPLALAAGSPTLTAGAATAIGQTAATLHGTVNPNGLATTYQFQYGPTNALGKGSPVTVASAGAGTAAVAETTKLSGLSPATTYYYTLVATNSAGSSSTPVETFKTTGNPAPGATTDPAAAIARYGATLVGTISPNNQATTYYFEYGLTTNYGLRTNAVAIAAGTAPVTVSLPLPGLAPGTVFHYRLVASHGSTSTTYGADVAFGTLPWPRPHTSLKATVSPRSVKRAPARFTVRGQVGLAYTTPAALGCKGIVTISYYNGKHRLSSTKVALAPNCAYNSSTRVHGVGKGRKQITVKLRFGGNTYVAPSTKQTTVTVG